MAKWCSCGESLKQENSTPGDGGFPQIDNLLRRLLQPDMNRTTLPSVHANEKSRSVQFDLRFEQRCAVLQASSARQASPIVTYLDGGSAICEERMPHRQRPSNPVARSLE